MDEELYKEAAKATGIEEKTKLIHMGLKKLIEDAAIQRLIKLFGSCKDAKAPPRRRFK